MNDHIFEIQAGVTGAETKIKLDGVELDHVTGYSVNCPSTDSLTKITVEGVAELLFTGHGELRSRLFALEPHVVSSAVMRAVHVCTQGSEDLNERLKDGKFREAVGLNFLNAMLEATQPKHTT